MNAALFRVAIAVTVAAAQTVPPPVYSDLSLLSNNTFECSACESISGRIAYQTLNDCLAEVPPTCEYSIKVIVNGVSTSVCSTFLGHAFGETTSAFSDPVIESPSGVITFTLNAARPACRYDCYMSSDENCIQSPPLEGAAAKNLEATAGLLSLDLGHINVPLKYYMNFVTKEDNCGSRFLLASYNEVTFTIRNIKGMLEEDDGEEEEDYSSLPEVTEDACAFREHVPALLSSPSSLTLILGCVITIPWD